jgi:hypothetical protein
VNERAELIDRIWERDATPMSAAGTIPNCESAEYLPPIVGSPVNTCRNPRSPAMRSRSEPGSVIAMNAAPRLPVRSQK